MALWEHCEQYKQPNGDGSVRSKSDCVNWSGRPKSKPRYRQSNGRGWKLNPMKTESNYFGQFTKNRGRFGIGLRSRLLCLHPAREKIRTTSKEQINNSQSYQQKRKKPRN